MNEPKFRVKYIDAAKFFGILFIVIGHVLRNGFFRQVIYAFNVPLFFFFAGITFDLQNKELTHFVKRKIERRAKIG